MPTFWAIFKHGHAAPRTFKDKKSAFRQAKLLAQQNPGQKITIYELVETASIILPDEYKQTGNWKELEN